MRYFYKVHIQASEKEKVNLFITLPEELKDGKIPELTAEQIMLEDVYKTFAEGKTFKRVFAVYTIYKTEDDYTQIAPVYQAEHFNKLIEDKTAVLISSGEVELIQGKKPGVPAKNKKKKAGKTPYLLIAGVAAVTLIVGFVAGGILGGSSKGEVNVLSNYNADEDGLIMPETVEFKPNAELITISIDRSYNPVPREDIQIKGEVINGVATITLPLFNRSEFFVHVPGYTWGFTSDPTGTKIEYYGGTAYNFTGDVKLYRVLVKYGGGNGTKDDPYIINYYDQLSLMAEEKVEGYFRQTADIVFPAWINHTPIDSINILYLQEILPPDAIRFEYDGGGYMISELNNSLFGTVSGSVIKNVNITGANINTIKHENLGLIVNQAYNYRYEVDGSTYETGETLIKNCTVSHSAITVQLPTVDADGNPIPQNVPPAENPVIPPDMELTDEQIEGFYSIPAAKQGEYAIGGVSGLGGQIENCYVTNVWIYAGLNDYFLYAGGISGKPANVTSSGVYNLTISGNIFHAGGIAGSAGGSRLYAADGRTSSPSTELPVYYGGNIQGCYVRGFSSFVDTSAGGIVGEAGINAADALISNCYTTGLDLIAGVFEDNDRTKPIKLGKTGGIIGKDGNESNGHFITNTVSAADYAVIGSKRKSNFDDTVRLAPAYAYYQAGILDVINRNTVHINDPGEIFTGNFIFAEDGRNSDEGGAYPFPAQIAELFNKTMITEES